MAAPKKRFSCWQIGCALLVLSAAVLLIPVAIAEVRWRQMHRTPDRTRCLSNLRQVSVATLMYTVEHDEVLPRGDNWARTTASYADGEAEQIYHCPRAPDEPKLSYAMNPAVEGLPLRFIGEPQETVMLFDGLHGKLVERHDGSANYCFVDGHVKSLEEPPAGILEAGADYQ